MPIGLPEIRSLVWIYLIPPAGRVSKRSPHRRGALSQQTLLASAETTGLEALACSISLQVRGSLKVPKVNQKLCLGAFSLLGTSYLQHFLSDQRDQLGKALIFQR